MKRKICLLLCVAMLFSMVALFSSCTKGDYEPKVSKKVVDVDLSEYKVVLAADLSKTVKSQAATMATALSDLTKLSVRQANDNEKAVVETADFEILVGNTFRTETVKAMKGLGQFGWTIRVFDNKICIVGTNSYLTMEALSYFMRNYVNGEAIHGSKISVNQKVTQKKIDTVDLVEEIEDPAGNYMSGLFQIVYDDLVDDDKNTVSNYENDPQALQGGVAFDYRYDLAVTLGKSMANKTDSAATTFLKKDDTAEESEFEVLVGNMDREIVKEELNKIEANQYGIVIRDGKIILLAWNDVAVEAAAVLFEELMAICQVDDGKGNLSYMIPASSYIVFTLANNWNADFPKPEGKDLYLHGTVDVGDNSLEYIYSGTGANETAYTAYCTKLEANGYSLYGTEVKKLNNIFRYYVNNATGSALYVYYSPYSFAEEQQVRNDYVAGIRIIASNTAYVTLPDTSILKPNFDSSQKICETTITTLDFDESKGSFGLCYIIRLEDGTFIVFDGGAGGGPAGPGDSWVESTEDGPENRYAALLKLYKEAHNGAEPTAANPLHIRAWLMTHEHGDHYNVFQRFLKKYGNQSDFRMDYFLFNAVSESECYNSNNPGNGIRKNLAQMNDNVKNGFKYIKVHTGQTFYFANMKLEILYTHEDTYPKGLEYFNNSSTVFKTTFMNGSAEGDTGIWTGDLERIGSRRLRAMWGREGMKADMVQVAHHGWNGVEAELYDLISPEIVWFPSNAARYRDTIPGRELDGKWWFKGVDYHICYKVDSVKIIIMSDRHNATMTFREGKVDRTWLAQGNANADHLRDLIDNAPLTHDNETIIFPSQR